MCLGLASYFPHFCATLQESQSERFYACGWLAVIEVVALVITSAGCGACCACCGSGGEWQVGESSRAILEGQGSSPRSNFFVATGDHYGSGNQKGPSHVCPDCRKAGSWCGCNRRAARAMFFGCGCGGAFLGVLCWRVPFSPWPTGTMMIFSASNAYPHISMLHSICRTSGWAILGMPTDV